MKVTILDKIKIIFSVYSIIGFFSCVKKKISLLFRPLDAPRYIEFAYLKKFIDKNDLHNLNILDVSSPYVMSYILSKKNKVIKTDIDSSEKKFIEENKNLIFKIEDATQLSFSDNTFDFVYSVSVIEHIYEKYIRAIKEMIRVTKDGGYVYITFPVAEHYLEEWENGDVYEKQYKNNGKTFFQYRFDEKHVENIINEITKNEVILITKDIFWEKRDGAYNSLIKQIKNKKSNIYVNFIKNVIINIWYGFNLFRGNPSQDFINAKSCGNMHIILKKCCVKL